MAHVSDKTLLPLGSQSDSSTLCPALQQYAQTLYEQAWTAYRAVGCPYGTSDRAMFVWYSLRDESDGPPLVIGKN